MPNNEDEWIDEALATLKSELADLGTRYFKREIPDIMTLTDLRKLVTDEAKAAIQAKLLEARLDEFFKARDAWHGTDDDEFAQLMNIRYHELQASAPTEKGEDHE